MQNAERTTVQEHVTALKDMKEIHLINRKGVEENAKATMTAHRNFLVYEISVLILVLELVALTLFVKLQITYHSALAQLASLEIHSFLVEKFQ